jgi:hypothetical protein
MENEKQEKINKIKDNKNLFAVGCYNHIGNLN